LLDRQLADSGVHLQIIFDHMTEGIVVLNRDGSIALMNKAAARLLNIPDGPETASASSSSSNPSSVFRTYPRYFSARVELLFMA
jgi:PAS domain-containing protein